MWKLFGFLGGSQPKAGKRAAAIDSMFQALDEGQAERPRPTLVCRTCGLKYENTGTYLQGSRCPTCFPAS